jgi:hypothetical protein
MNIYVGEVAYDFGFKQGYFLYDLFLKNGQMKGGNNLVPFLVTGG